MAFTLRNTLRPGAENDPDDLRAARGALRHAGFFLPEPPPEKREAGA
ncbi:MAG: hypothetical protein HOH66_01935 [Rhodospirillaceae bacterium]|jgi:hypothetical protein|nr:hypothetical protein [Rhodospirillaceae bacterium]MBT6116612.1 hypothetical protein [Rhodospirillaceae bacterium]